MKNVQRHTHTTKPKSTGQGSHSVEMSPLCALWSIRTLPQQPDKQAQWQSSVVRQVYYLGHSLYFSDGCHRDFRSDQRLCSRFSVKAGSQDFSSVRRWQNEPANYQQVLDHLWELNCSWLGSYTTAVHNTAQNIADNFPAYPPDDQMLSSRGGRHRLW